VAFGPFHFDLAHQLLHRGAEPVPLGRRGGLILLALLARRGEVLSKAELVDAAWPDESVEESNLSVQVAQLRRRLGAAPGGGDWIVTVERVGYRFVPEQQVPASRERRTSLAVLPFTDMGDAESFAFGLVEDLTTALARFSSLAVVARSSSFQYDGRAADLREAGRRLEADYVIEGSVRRSDGRIRTTAQLIDTRDGTHVWATRLDTAEPDLLEAQRHLSDRLAGLVEPQIQRHEMEQAQRDRPGSVTTRDRLLRARRLMTATHRDGHAAAYGLLTDVLRDEPENVDAISAAAEVLHHGIAVGWPALTDDDRTISLELAQRGAYLTHSDGGALGIFSNAMFTAYEHDLAAATMLRGVDANPNSSLALVCTGLGYLFLNRLELAEKFCRAALELGPDDPNRKFALAGLASTYRRRGEHETAIAIATQAVAVNPNMSAAYWTLIASNAQLGRLDLARRHLRRYQQVAPGVTIASIRAGQPYTDPRIIAPLLEGLWVAGMPEA
jgi:TolB-like protein